MHENISPEKLLEAGYVQVDPKVALILDKSIVSLWRKKIRDELGIRYCISIRKLDVNPHQGTPDDYWIKAETHFRFTNGGHSTVTHSIDTQEIEDVEDYFEEIWTHMGFDHIEGGHDYDAASATGDA